MNNCFFFALSKWFKNGGYLAIRKSHLGNFPHFLWIKDLKNADLEHYTPIEPPDKQKERFIDKFLFKGKVSKSDETPQ